MLPGRRPPVGDSGPLGLRCSDLWGATPGLWTQFAIILLRIGHFWEGGLDFCWRCRVHCAAFVLHLW